MALINEAAIAAVLPRHMPWATVIFITDSDGNRTVVAFTDPPEPVIASYWRRGYCVDSGQELKEVS